MAANDRPKTVLDEYKLRITTKPLATGAKPPALVVNVYRNNPQITVFTGHDNGSGITRITAGMDPKTFCMLIASVLHFSNPQTPAGKLKIENKKPIPKEQRTDPKVKNQVVTETLIGKDEDGRVWIAIQDAKNAQAPKIQFYFGMDYYHAAKATDGEGLVSQLAAQGWANLFQTLVLQVLVDNGVDPQNQGTTSNYQNKGGQSNAVTSSMDDFDSGFDDFD